VIRLVALDMGGVLLRNESRATLPGGRLDYRGREALVQWFAQRGERCDLSLLSEKLFEPWIREYRQRSERGAEASWTPYLEALRSALGSTASDEEILATWFRPYGEQLSMIEGALEALAGLRSLGCRLALVSNVPMPGSLYRARMDHYGLLEPFDTVFFSYDFGSRKPSPAMLRTALEEGTAAPAEAVMVGDRPTLDIACGLSAGVRTVWVESDFSKGPRADASIRSVGELPALIERWNRK